VSCASPNACTAIGTTNNGNPDLIEHWNGQTWQVQHPARPVGALYLTLTNISCGSATSCSIVGNDGLLEHWDGARWSIDRPAVGTGPNAVLDAISCSSATTCMAVGQNGSHVLIERWTGGPLVH
jgi:hypothetical protein